MQCQSTYNVLVPWTRQHRRGARLVDAGDVKFPGDLLETKNLRWYDSHDVMLVGDALDIWELGLSKNHVRRCKEIRKVYSEGNAPVHQSCWRMLRCQRVAYRT